MIIDRIKFKKIKRKVQSQYPNACTCMTSSGLFYVSDGTGNIITSDYMLPAQPTVTLAWYWIAEILRIDNNIQRTNPKRMDNASFERKFNRISRRNSKI